MTRGAPVALLLAAGCAALPALREVEDARRADDDAVLARAAEIDAPAWANQFVVVQEGAIAAAAPLAGDAVRAAESRAAGSVHRFVFRPGERGPRLHRLAYVPDGGVVAGRRFLADLGLEAVGPAGAPSALRRRAGGATLELTRTPRIDVGVAALDGSAHRTLRAAFDADFDGGLLVPRDVAASLALERFEVPGVAEVQVALGRPFRAHRATVIATLPALGASGPAEVLFETARVSR